MARTFLVIIDGLGVGAQEDAGQYGDEQADTLGNVSRIANVKLPNFEKLGLGNIRTFHSINPVKNPKASFGKMREKSAGKDSTTGHWEFAGIHLDKPFPTYPNGFPDDVLTEFCEGIGVEDALCNLPYSGTKVIEDYGERHIKTGYPIVYTSADSVFQIACHADLIPLKSCMTGANLPEIKSWLESTRWAGSLQGHFMANRGRSNVCLINDMIFR